MSLELNILDKVVSYFSPELGLKRIQRRNAMDILQRGYEGARKDRRTKGWNVNEFEEAAFQNRGIYNVYLKSLKQIISILKVRTEQFCSTSPHSRYEEFLETRPFTSQNANRKYIANFLGITPNSLSRMTARIHKKRNERKK